jgi:chromate reductase, NAD(P)H dehydrogenase (quinone)
MMRLLAISGSLRRRSYNSALLDAVAAESRRPSVEFVFWNHLDRIPAYNEDAEIHQPEPVAVLKDEIAGADAVLFATPEYNGSIPGALKNAIDWISRPFADNPLRDKPVAVIGASQGGFGATWAQAELRRILQATGARVHAGEFALAHAQHAFGADGLVLDPQQRAALASIVDALVIDTCRRAA